MSFSKILHKTTALLSALSIALSPLCHAEIQPGAENSVTVNSRAMQLDQLKYDDIIYLLDALESGELEAVCNEEDLEKITEFFAVLAREGAEEGDIELEHDIEELEQDTSDSESFMYSCSSEKKGGISAICYKSKKNKDKKKKKKETWAAKKWRNTKRFARDHKKEIIIGAAIVVCATVATVAIVALASTEVATAGATGAAAALGAGSGGGGSESDRPAPRKEPRQPLNPPPPVLPDIPSVPGLGAGSITLSVPDSSDDLSSFIASQPLNFDHQEIYNRQRGYFKENIQNEVYAAPPLPGDAQRSPSFLDNVRGVGSYLTHEVIDAIDESIGLPVFIADLAYKEMQREVGEYLPSPDGTFVNEGTPLENYGNFITKAHQAVDELFSTDWARDYTPEAKAKDPFVYGIIPPPGEVFPGFVKAAGSAFKRTGNVTVYRSFNEITGEVNYVGITSRFRQRSIEHFKNKGILIEKMRGLNDLTRSDARAVEQTLIELHKLKKNGGTLINKINSIAETNPKYAEALKRGTQILKETGHLD